jgi:maleylacetate reductase
MESGLPSWSEPGGFVHEARVLPGRSVRVVFGEGALARVGDEVRALGGSALLVAGRHEDGAADSVRAQLGGLCAGRLRDVEQHVPVPLADAAAARAQELRVQVLVSVGGGSATGLAKATALVTGLPLLAVPTTYAGSEMTSIWGLTDRVGKTTGRDPRVLPSTVVYDPSLTATLPAGLVGASGMNALAHALEASYAPDVTPMLGMVAGEALRALASALPARQARPGDRDARAQALYGAWLAGWSLGSTTMGLHHKLAHVVAGGYRLPHAGVHSALLPQVAAFNAAAAGPAFAVVATALGVAGPREVATALFDLAAVLGAPTSLAGLGLDPGVIDEIASNLAGSAVVNPRPVTAAGVRGLLRAAYAGTRPLP